MAAVVFFASIAFAAEKLEIVREGQEYSYAQAEPVMLEGSPAVAVVFEGSGDMHYYATADSAPSPGLELKISAKADGLAFKDAISPKPKPFFDPGQEKNIEVYVGDFESLVPMENPPPAGVFDAEITITGVACTSRVCLTPFTKKLSARIDFSKSAGWRKIEALPQGREKQADKAAVIEGSSLTTAAALALALLAGLSFNVMPCVWPVIPLVLSRLFGQAQERPARRIALGMVFCAGIVIFFLGFAAIAAAVKITTGAAFNWSDHLRYPAVIVAMGLFLVAFGLFMFDIFGITIPSAVASKGASGTGFAGSLGMGFLAALLSTPCSGAILAAVVVWAQTQTVFLSSAAFVLMGVGMAAPYAVIVFIPSLLKMLPRPGAWMEILRKSMGFILLIIAVKILGALPKERIVGVLYYAVVLSFCLWMWGSWVNLTTPRGKRWTVRFIAAAIAVVCGLWLLPAEKKIVDWQGYDAGLIAKAVSQNQPVVIKFTADWCTNCVVVEKRVYKDPQVAEMIRKKNVLAVKADTTSIDMPATKDLVKVYGESGTVPVSIILLPGGKQVKLRGIFDKEKLIAILEEIRN